MTCGFHNDGSRFGGFCCRAVDVRTCYLRRPSCQFVSPYNPKFAYRGEGLWAMTHNSASCRSMPVKKTSTVRMDFAVSSNRDALKYGSHARQHPKGKKRIHTISVIVELWLVAGYRGKHQRTANGVVWTWYCSLNDVRDDS